MKIEITPEYLGDRDPHYWYWSVVKGEKLYSCGESWQQARMRHLDRLRDIIANPTLPPTETIEI